MTGNWLHAICSLRKCITRCGVGVRPRSPLKPSLVRKPHSVLFWPAIELQMEFMLVTADTTRVISYSGVINIIIINGLKKFDETSSGELIICSFIRKKLSSLAPQSKLKERRHVKLLLVLVVASFFSFFSKRCVGCFQCVLASVKPMW